MTFDRIINYVQLTEDIATSGQPRPEDFPAMAEAGYSAVVNLAMPDSPGAFPEEGGRAAEAGLCYFHIPVPFDAPRPGHLALFIKILKALAGKKIWVHCAMNYRVSAFMFHYLRLVHGLAPEQARSPVFEEWEPDEVWQEFLKIGPEVLDL